MRPLTEAEREALIHQVAMSLCWSAVPTADRDHHTYRARIVVKHLEAVAVSGATAKRAAEKVCSPDADPT